MNGLRAKLASPETGGFAARNFTPDDYRLLDRIITDWLGEGFSSGEATLLHAEAIRDWIRNTLALYERAAT